MELEVSGDRRQLGFAFNVSYSSLFQDFSAIFKASDYKLIYDVGIHKRRPLTTKGK